MEKTEILTQETFQKNIDLYVDKLTQKKLDKLLIKTPNKDDVVILRRIRTSLHSDILS